MSIRALRALTTVYLAFVIGQAGFGSGVLDGMGDLLLIHNINAFLVVGLGIACLVGGILYRREGGPFWPIVFAGVLVAVSILQAVLGQTGVRGPHIFLGILFLSGVVTLCSYTWRHKPATAGTPSGGNSSGSNSSGSGSSRRGAENPKPSGTAGTTVPPAAPAGGTSAG